MGGSIGTIQWAPRVIAIAFSMFLAVFALDELRTSDFVIVDAIASILLHLLPSAIVLAVVALSWRREWIGAAVFIALAIAYAVTARDHLSWVAVISGPLVVAGSLYWATWIRRARFATR